MSAAMSDEGGFTLIETLAMIVILGIVMVPLTGAMVTGLRSSDHTAEVLTTSVDRGLLSAYLPPDVASATTVDVAPGAGMACGPAQGNVVSLGWQEFSPPSTVTSFTAAYREQLVPAAAPEYQLVRYACTNGAATSSRVLARSLHDATATATPGGEVSVAFTDTLDKHYTITAGRRSM